MSDDKLKPQDNQDNQSYQAIQDSQTQPIAPDNSSQTPTPQIVQPVALAQDSPQPDQLKNRNFKILVLVVTGLVVTMVGILLIVSRQSTPEVLNTDVFAPVGEIENDELLATSLQRLLNVNELSYSIELSGQFSVVGDVSYTFNEDGADLYANYAITDDDGAIGIELLANSYSEDTYFKITQADFALDESNEWEDFLGKWILINEETTQDIAAGSEFIVLLLFQGVQWEVPFLFGDLAGSMNTIPQLTDDSLYSIVESEEVTVNDVTATKLTVEAQVDELSQIIEDSISTDEQQSLVTPGVTLRSYSLLDEREPAQFTITIYQDNAQPAEVGFVSSDQDFGVRFSDSSRYYGFEFSGVDIPDAPSDWLPFNEFYPTNSEDSSPSAGDPEDAERTTSVNALFAQVEAYHAQNGFYPTATNLASSQWIEENMQGLSREVISALQSGSVTYTPTPFACDNVATLCAQHIISVDLAEDGLGGSDADSDTADFVQESLN